SVLSVGAPDPAAIVGRAGIFPGRKLRYTRLSVTPWSRPPRGSGGIGRRAGLRNLSGQLGEGSNPSFRTNLLSSSDRRPTGVTRSAPDASADQPVSSRRRVSGSGPMPLPSHRKNLLT